MRRDHKRLGLAMALIGLLVGLAACAGRPIGTPLETRPDGAVRLTTPPAGASDQNPAFSPDGTRIVFTRFDDGYNDGPAGLFLLDTSSGQVTRLTPWEDQDNVNLPGAAWALAEQRSRGAREQGRPPRSPAPQHPSTSAPPLNGGRIVFASDRAEANDLWRIAPDGTDFSRITTHTGLPWYFEPSWSPALPNNGSTNGGGWIVFEASRPGQSEDGRVGEIWKVRADGTGLAQLTGAPGFDDRQPNWSPAGDRVLFQRRSLPSGQWDIYTMAPDGTGLRNVTDDPAADDTDASWSPDGRFIVYSSDHGGLPTPNIFVIPATGGQPVRVTQSAISADGAPSWSPALPNNGSTYGGQWIAFESHADDETPASLWRIAAPSLNATWPDWAFEARLAGASFELDMTDAEIDAKLQQAADEGVSVLVADAPTGWSYTAWADDAEFNQVLALMRDRVFPGAHARGLKVVWYLTALELICEGCVYTGRDPAAEHPEWLQIDRYGNPLQFSGVQGVFWLNPDDLDAWLSPESPYRDFYMSRIRDIAAAGADGLWMDVAYLLNSIGQFDDLWPSYDAYSQAAFQAAYGHTSLPAKNWNDPTWRHFVRWRIASITRFVEDVAAAARAVDPDLVFFTENWGMDSNFVTQYAQDPLEFVGDPYVATAHELEPVDQDNTGMANATYKQWRDYALMVKFAVAANKGKPAWILTYAGAPDDSLREAGVHLAEGANFYEAKGPEMVDDSTGSRPTVFPWLAANAGMAYHSTSLAEVALWYSPRARDFVDGGNAGDDKYDYAGTTYIKEYRNRAQDLIKAQVPFDIVTGDWSLAELARYTWLVLPDARCLSDAEAALLINYANAGGKLAVTGNTGAMDEWCQSRTANALAGMATYAFADVTSDVVTTDLSARHKKRVLIEARTGTDAQGPFVFVPLANFNSSRVYTDVGITVRLPAGFTPTLALSPVEVTASWNAPDATGGALSYSVNGGRLSVTLPRLDTAAAVVIRGASSPATHTPTPTNTPTPTPTPTATPTATITVDKWALWTGGSQLRGANVWQRRVYPELDGLDFLGPGPVGPPYTQQDFDNLAALGANYVNISHPGLFRETPPYELDQDVQTNLDNLLAMIAQADMFAVISFRTGPGRSEFTFVWDEVGDWFDESYLNDSMWQDQAAQDAWVAMWRYTAQRYKDNPVVVGYDLMVEPNSNEVGSYPLGDPLDIWDPAEFYSTYGGTLYDWNQLYPRITTAIRQVDADTPILIGGNGYSAVAWLPYLQPTGDPRTVYMVHQYEPFVYTHQEPPLNNTYPGVFDTDWDGDDDQFNQAWLDNLLSAVDDFETTHGVPVSVNEFGVIRWEPGAAAFMDDQMDLFEGRGMNHALWVWDPAWEPWTQEVDAFNFRHGPDPDNHTDVASSDLIDVIVEHWGGNTLRPSAGACLADANGNEIVDVIDIMTTAQTPACWPYLPLMASWWQQPWSS